jgi:hypothetical protein
MYREPLRGKWSHEPIFPSTGAQKPDGTWFAYFCHMVYDGEYSHTVRVEEMGKDAWEATIEDSEGECFHRMREPYPTYREAFEDALGWASGQ